jgi:hypothetical protein
MASLQSIMIKYMEDQAALLQKHISILKGLPPQQMAQLPNGSGAVVPPPMTAAAAAKAKREKDKKEKDPNKPKKAASAYLLFMQENQAPFRLANPTMTQMDLMSNMGKQWSLLPPEGKVKYHEMAEQEKLAYFKRMTAYNLTKGLPPHPGAAVDLTGASSSSSAAAKPVKSPKAPKPAASAFAAPAPSPVASPAAAVPTPVAVKAPKPSKKAPVTEPVGVPAAAVFQLPVPEPAVEGSEKKKKKDKKRKSEESGTSGNLAAEAGGEPEKKKVR